MWFLTGSRSSGAAQLTALGPSPTNVIASTIMTSYVAPVKSRTLLSNVINIVHNTRHGMFKCECDIQKEHEKNTIRVT